MDNGEERSQQVELAGLNDKWQITAVLCGSLTGVFLPPRVIYKGKTGRWHPTFNFPCDWRITNSENQWANEDTTVDYINNIIVPYLQQVRKILYLNNDHPALAIYDCFRGQVTESVSTLLEENNIHVVVVPANCTGHLQPLDLSLNKSVKDFLRREFQI